MWTPWSMVECRPSHYGRNFCHWAVLIRRSNPASGGKTSKRTDVDVFLPSAASKPDVSWRAVDISGMHSGAITPLVAQLLKNTH